MPPAMVTPRLALVAVLVGIVNGIVGCSTNPAATTSVAGWPSPISDEDRITWAADEPLFVVIRKACRTLDVYRYGERIASFPAVFGLGGGDPKRYEGDLRTPEGLYSIIETRPHSRWGHFFLLDYPNSGDQYHYQAALNGGEIPLRDGSYPGMGGAVGIHGTDKPDLNRRGVDWTWGCISLSNPDMDQLASLVSVGTPVLIED